MTEEQTKATVAEIRARLVELGGRTSQDIGLGRIVGQILVHLYLHEAECSLDDIGRELGLSKAAVSIAARQLEAFGMICRVWRKGDRRSYYRTADNIASALQKGLLTFVGQKVASVGVELDAALAAAKEISDGQELAFLRSRVERAASLRDRAVRLMNNPLVKMLVGG